MLDTGIHLGVILHNSIIGHGDMVKKDQKDLGVILHNLIIGHGDMVKKDQKEGQGY